jgi:Lrp/AsnC family leucine-responsive transcriptional regulator
MRGLDETDEEILDILLDDGRKPYSEIAEAVGLSAPAVSDRIDRLREIGLLRRFTVDLDRGLLREGQSFLLTVEGVPGSGARIAGRLQDHPATEHVFRTVDDTVVCTLVASEDSLEELLAEELADGVREYDLGLLADSTWEPSVGEATLAPDCVECGNTVTAEGEREQFDGETYHFCCSSCLASFRDRYETLKDGT